MSAAEKTGRSLLVAAEKVLMSFEEWCPLGYENDDELQSAYEAGRDSVLDYLAEIGYLEFPAS